MRSLETCIMICPQCEGEGSYADGLDEDACTTTCTRCESNGWIVDTKALATFLSESAGPDAIEYVAKALYNSEDPWNGEFEWPFLNGHGIVSGYRALARVAIATYKQFIEQTG